MAFHGFEIFENAATFLLLFYVAEDYEADQKDEIRDIGDVLLC